MRSKDSSCLSSIGRGAERRQVAAPSPPSDKHASQDASIGQSEGCVCDVVSLILDEISRYEAGSLDYRVFEPIVSDHPLHRLVSRLRAIDPDFFLPGTNGKSQWRKVVQSSVVPSDTDYLKIFDELTAFEILLFEHYMLAWKGDAKLDDKSSSANPTNSPNLDLNRTQCDVFETIGSEPLRGSDIAKKAGYKYDTVRHVLPRLIKKGYILKCKQGYVRRVNTCEHVTDTSQAQTQ